MSKSRQRRHQPRVTDVPGEFHPGRSPDRQPGSPDGPPRPRTGRVARSTARSASDHPCSRSPSTSWRCTVVARHQPLDPHPDQPDPGPLQARARRSSPAAVAVDLAGHVGGLGHRAGAGDRGEVGEPHLERDGAAGHPGGPHPAGSPWPRAAAARAATTVAVVGVAAEGLVGAHALVGLVRARGGRGRRRSVPQARWCSWRPRRPPTARWRVASGVCATSPTVRRPSRCSSSRVFSPTP